MSPAPTPLDNAPGDAGGDARAAEPIELAPATASAPPRPPPDTPGNPPPGRPDAPVYALRNVEFSYPGHGGERPTPVLRKVSLAVPRGKLLVILGPNGSGKTTLLRCMAGLINPSAGQVLLDDVSIYRRSLRELARKVALVPQETQPAFDYSVLQVVLMGRGPHLGPFGFESPADLALARQCLAQTDTLHLAGRQFDELSSGERQRVVIARALAQQPRVLLLDEPTSFLDIGHQLQIYQLLKRLAGDGMTVVCVSHDLNTAGQFADELVLIHRGTIARQGSADAVLTADTLAGVYGVQCDVVRHPRTGRPIILPCALPEPPGSDGPGSDGAAVTGRGATGQGPVDAGAG